MVTEKEVAYMEKVRNEKPQPLDTGIRLASPGKCPVCDAPSDVGITITGWAARLWDGEDDVNIHLECYLDHCIKKLLDVNIGNLSCNEQGFLCRINQKTKGEKDVKEN